MACRMSTKVRLRVDASFAIFPEPLPHSPAPSIFISRILINLQIPLPATPFFSHVYKSPGGTPYPLFCFAVQHRRLSTIHFLFCCLRTLLLSCKTQLVCFQRNASSFAKNAGVADNWRSWVLSGAQERRRVILRHSDVLT